jgi:hypothetical protein
LQLNTELEISLSLIESGCIATSINDETLFIFKHSEDVIESLRRVETITFELECLKRPEFPTIAMLFCLEGTSDVYRFEYPFAIESEQDMELLKKLLDQDHFSIYFFDERIRYRKMVSLNDIDAEGIKSMIIEAVN